MQRALIYALGTALVTLTFCLSVTAYAYPIYPADKAVLMDWLSSWKYSSKLLQINSTTTDCDSLVQLRRFNVSSVFCVDDDALQYSRISFLNLGNYDSDPDNNAASTSIPAAIGQLTELTGMTLFTTGTTGSLPEQLFRLPKLKQVFLNGNKLYGALPATLSNATLLERLDLAYNMFSGVIPDLSGLTNMYYLRLSHNNFGCPQPYMRPSLTTRSRYPNFAPANCSFDNNLLAEPIHGYNTVCGERIEDYLSQAACSWKVQPVPVVKRPQNPQWVLNPRNGTLKLEVENGTHAFVPVDTASGRLANLFMVFDFFTLTTYAIKDRDNEATYATYKFKGYKSALPLPTNPLVYRFSGELEGIDAQFDTLWDFSLDKDQIKFSFEIRNMTFPAEHDRVAINMQIGIKLPFITRETNTTALKCKGRNLINISDFRRQDDVFKCSGVATSLRLNIDIHTLDDVSLVLDLDSPRGNATISFPVLYEKDGTPNFLAATNTRIQMMPFGGADTVNFLNVPDHPVNAIYNNEMLFDPQGTDQFSLLSMGIELEKFSDSLIYDPTVLLSTVFENPPVGTTPQAIQESNIAAIASGSVAAVVVAAVVVIAVAAVVSPRFRNAIRPFASRDRLKKKKGLAQAFGEIQDEEEQPRARAPPSSGSKPWVAAQPHSS